MEENLQNRRMKLKDFVKEHHRLIQVLKKGTKAQQTKEAKKQQKELKKMLEKQKK